MHGGDFILEVGGGDWASHMMEHELGGMFDVAHGAGLAAIWGSWHAMSAGSVLNDLCSLQSTLWVWSRRRQNRRRQRQALRRWKISTGR